MVIATIVLGPERMAQAGRELGRLYGQYRVRWQKDVDEMTRELRRELETLQQEVEDIRQSAESEIKSAQAALEGAVDIKVGLDAADVSSDTSDAAAVSTPEPVEIDPLGGIADTPIDLDDTGFDGVDTETVDADVIAEPAPAESEPLGGVGDTPVDAVDDRDRTSNVVESSDGSATGLVEDEGREEIAQAQDDVDGTQEASDTTVTSLGSLAEPAAETESPDQTLVPSASDAKSDEVDR
jgi:Sec-independent protein translocase protein TatA